jgi:hypothetical protein
VASVLGAIAGPVVKGDQLRLGNAALRWAMQTSVGSMTKARGLSSESAQCASYCSDHTVSYRCEGATFRAIGAEHRRNAGPGDAQRMAARAALLDNIGQTIVMVRSM